MNQPEMACTCDDGDWAAQQAQDEAVNKQVLNEAFKSLYLAINRLEVLDNCEYTDLRRDIRFIELKVWGK